MGTTTTEGQEVSAVQGSVRNWLIGMTLFVAAAIVFGLLYLFVIAPSIPSGNANVGWFLFSFATGLTMIIMPCTLPLAFVIVPLSMGKGLVRGLGMALAFGLGIALTLSLYGVAAALLGGVAIDALGADLESLKNWVYFIAGTFAFLFALSEIGLLNVHMPTYSGAAPAFIQKRQEILKAFFLGLFLGNVGVGCPHPATPLILIEIASSGDVFYGWLMFLIHAIGRILPLLLLAFLAILGVNGLNWLMARKATLERVTGWAMVFVAGFILTLGLFSHDWWVNSGIHSALETLTQESKFNTLMNNTLGTNVAHLHGLETGSGLFGLPLEWGSIFLVTVWLIPIWWWYFRKRRAMQNSPAFKLQMLEAHIDRLEKDRRQVESMLSLDEIEATYDLKHAQDEIDALEKVRREEESKVQFGEKGVFKDPLARSYEARILGMQRNYLLVISGFLILVFAYYLPTNFYYKSMSGMGDHHAAADPMAGHDHSGVPAQTGTTNTSVGTAFTTDTYGLPEAQRDLQFVELKDGDTYTITAGYVKKELGNRTLRMLAYNGSIPGPFIKVKEGSTIKINFVNNTDVDQTIHSHGVRLDNTSDGVPGVTQYAVKPGQSYEYTVKFPDAGVAWYHPHTRDDYGQELGLYGNYFVEPNDPDYWSPVNRELPLVVDDILIENNQIQNFYKEYTNHALLGRFGSEYLVNGTMDYSLDVQKGEVIRFQITNVSNARTYRLIAPGAVMKIVGADLSKYENEYFADEVVISPAERLTVEMYFAKSGKVKLQNKMRSTIKTLAEFDVNDTAVETSYSSEFNNARRDESLTSTFSEFRNYVSKAPDKKLKLTVALTGTVDHSAHAHGATTDISAHDHTAMMASPDHAAMMAKMSMESLEWGENLANDAVNTTKNVEWQLVDEATGKVNMNIPISDWTFKQGQLVKIRLTNDMAAAHVMQHPIHLHGQRFVVLTEDGIVNKNMAWKDTAMVPPGGYLDVLVDMSNQGDWMLHCHIVEHLFAGMMMPFRVEDQNGNANGDDFRKSLVPTQAAPVASAPLGTNTFSYTDTPQSPYTAVIDLKRVSVGKKVDIAFSFKDQQNASVNLSSTAKIALQVTFVHEDGTTKVVTYPGNTAFDAVPTQIPVPAGDGHNHIHYLGAKTVYAHGDIVTDNHHAGTQGRTYSVPVMFTKSGNYKAFVEFILEGEETPRITMVPVTVGSWSIDDYGMTPQVKWWTLLLISLVLMGVLSRFVYKYLNSEKQ